MKHMYTVLVLLCGTTLLTFPLADDLSISDSEPALVQNKEEDDFFGSPLNVVKTSTSEPALNGKIYSFFKNIYDYAQEEQRLFALKESKKIQDCVLLLQELEHINTKSVFIKKVTEIWTSLTEIGDPSFAQEEDLKKKAKRIHTLLMHGLFLRTILILNQELNKHAVNCLREIEQRINFWEYQLHHPTHHFFHKSPLRWFSKESQELSVKKNLYLLRHYQSYFFKTIGRLTRHLDAFSETMTLRTQRTWLMQSAYLLHEHFNDEHAKAARASSEHEIFLQMITDLESFSTFDTRIKKELHPASVPYHFLRYWMEYSTGVCFAAGVAMYAYLNHDKMASLAQRAHASSLKTYQDTIRGPLLKIKEAIFGESIKKSLDGTPSSDNEVNVLATQFKEKVGQLGLSGPLAQKEPAQIEADRNELIVEYRTIITNYKDLLRRSAHAALIVDGSSAAHISALTEEQIHQAANRLDIDLLNTLAGAFGFQWGRSPFEVETVWGLKPSFKIKGEKSSLIDHVIPLAILYGRCRSLVVENKLRIAGEAADIAGQIGTIFAKQGDMVLTQNRLTIAALALIPAALTTYFGIKAVGKAGKYLIASEYDYTVLRKSFYSAARVLNLYDSAEYNHEQIKDEDLGNLLYSLQALKYEAYFLNEKDRWEFTEDIKQLASPEMNVRQKLRLLSIMINRYAFLHTHAKNGHSIASA